MAVYEYFTKINSLGILRHPLNTKIYIGPDNRVLILRKDYRTAEQNSIIFDQNGSYLISWISYFCFSNKFLWVDPSIVSLAGQIIKRKVIKQQGESEKNHLINRIAKLESNLDIIMEMIKHNNSNTKHLIEVIISKLDSIL